MKKLPKSSQIVKYLGWRLQAFLLVFIGIIISSNVVSFDSKAYVIQRSVELSTTIPGDVSDYKFTFSSTSAPIVGSIIFEFCRNSPLFDDPCIPPNGLVSNLAVLSYQFGDIGFSVHPDTLLTNNKVILTRTPTASITGSRTYTLSNIYNPTFDIGTSYVRISLLPTTDGSGAPSEWGSVAFSINRVFTLSFYVPPYLTLCSGVTVLDECQSTSGFGVDLGELSRISANTATSQFAIATNSTTGYVASVQGNTMTAGNRVISPVLGAPSEPGVSQFGINLTDNSTPNVGANVIGSGYGTVSTNYSTPNQFRFQSGDIVASSPVGTEFNTYTISYLINVSNSQPAGRYSTTLTVIATTTF